MKRFLITVDTEGDNQWCTWNGELVTTYNAKCIPRFQELCEAYGFAPVYLLTHEMAADIELRSYLKPKVNAGLCEVGTHLHAWNSPPCYLLPRKFSGNPYITEYPVEIMYEKLKALTEYIEQLFDVRPTSHRAGRWASNIAMFEVLTALKYTIDTSVVSGWDGRKIPGQTTECGFDYRWKKKEAYWINDCLLEVPMIVSKDYGFGGNNVRQILGHLIKGRDRWLRPAVADVKAMKKQLSQGADDYSMFMIHSTELMPGGSPYFRTAEDVEYEYEMIEQLFEEAAKAQIGTTLRDYRETKLRQQVKS